MSFIINQHSQATTFLAAIDADWAQLINTVGVCTFAPGLAETPYESLVGAIASQQLNLKAAAAIIAKLSGLFGNQFPTPEQLMAASFDDLRSCGFSGRKIETIQAIAIGALTGLVPNLQAAEKLSNEELITRLTTIKGIGRWTVEMFLMFTLGRVDILPVDDFAILQGYKRFKQLEAAPKPKEMAQIGLAWQPHRTVASWYLWRVPK